MNNRKISLRKRFMLIIALMLTTYLMLAVYTDYAARDTVTRSQDLRQDVHDLGNAMRALSDTLHLLGIAMYQSTLYQKGDEPEAIQIRVEQLSNQINKLLSLKAVKDHEEFYEPALSLSDSLKKITVEANALLDIQSNYERKYPAMPILLYRLQPINREMAGLITSAIEEAKQLAENQTEQREVLEILNEVRYVWAQMVSSVRVYVANRLGAFGPPKETMTDISRDRDLYSETVGELLSRLAGYGQKQSLGMIQADALKKMQVLHAQYEIYFRNAAEIYQSASWRADKTLLREKVDPMLDAAWSQVFLIQNRVNAHSQAGMSQFAKTADTLSNYIWLAAIITMSLLFLGYFVFEYFIRKPIAQVANALEAEGKGEDYKPKIDYLVPETEVLVSAFSDMRSQIRSRQLRLQTILDNTVEGIITINAQGQIEQLNDASASLFGYAEEEILGKDISLLIPAYLGLSNQNNIMLLLNQASENLRREQEVLGKRSDGQMFPMALRIGKANIEGNIMFTALVSDISERKAMIDRLTHLAERDSLTGLYNRHFLMDELERIIDRANRGEQQSIALLYIDLDNFKFVNDTLGHLAGDKLLQEITVTLERRARGTDLVARLGGDEFAIILYDINELQAKYTAEAYRKQMAEYLFHYQGKTVDVGCSIGVAFLERNINKKEELLARADLACHIAKRMGRNRVHLYVPEDQQSLDLMSADMGWSRRIRKALEEDSFSLVSQPIVSSKDGALLSNELLIRLLEQDEIIMPSGFLSSVERFGLSVMLDQWVIRNSFKLLSVNDHDDFAGYSINLAGTTIGDVPTLEFIESVMIETKINPQKIIFEVTESSTVSNLEKAKTFLMRLQRLGFKTALDDFGVGYSSFTYLKDLPVDYVKLDGSFVKNLQHDKVKRAIVIAMNEVVHALGKKTVAEYVEDQHTFHLLEELGIDFCQGFYFGKPKSVHEKDAKVIYLHNK